MRSLMCNGSQLHAQLQHVTMFIALFTLAASPSVNCTQLMMSSANIMIFFSLLTRKKKEIPIRLTICNLKHGRNEGKVYKSWSHARSLFMRYECFFFLCSQLMKVFNITYSSILHTLGLKLIDSIFLDRFVDRSTRNIDFSWAVGTSKISPILSMSAKIHFPQILHFVDENVENSEFSLPHKPHPHTFMTHPK